MDNKLKKGDYLDVLLRSSRTVFSTKDVALLWGEENLNAARVRLSYYTRAGKLLRLRRGFYAKDKHYDMYELATKICAPSYISFETVLALSGLVFQHYSSIFVASYLNREIEVDGQKIIFKRMKDYVLSNTTGIERKERYSIATKERAFLDRLYISKDYHFDNLSALNWEKVFEILPIYNNKKMARQAKKYFDYCKKNK